MSNILAYHNLVLIGVEWGYLSKVKAATLSFQLNKTFIGLVLVVHFKEVHHNLCYQLSIHYVS